MLCRISSIALTKKPRRIGFDSPSCWTIALVSSIEPRTSSANIEASSGGLEPYVPSSPLTRRVSSFSIAHWALSTPPAGGGGGGEGEIT